MYTYLSQLPDYDKYSELKELSYIFDDNEENKPVIDNDKIKDIVVEKIIDIESLKIDKYYEKIGAIKERPPTFHKDTAVILWATCAQLNIDINGDIEDRIANIIGDISDAKVQTGNNAINGFDYVKSPPGKINRMRYEKYKMNAQKISRCTHEDTFENFLGDIEFIETEYYDIIIGKTLKIAVQKHVINMNVDSTYQKFLAHLRNHFIVLNSYMENIYLLIYLHDDFKFLESILPDDYTRTYYENLLKHDIYKDFLRIDKNLDMIPSNDVEMLINHLEDINRSIMGNFYKYEIGKLIEYYDENISEYVNYPNFNRVPTKIFREYVDELLLTKILGVLINSLYLQNLYTFNDKRIKNEPIDQSLRDEINTNRDLLRNEMEGMYNDKSISDEFLNTLLDTKYMIDEYKINEFIEIEQHDETFIIDWRSYNDEYNRLGVFEISTDSTVQCDSIDNDMDNNIDNDMTFIESLVSSGKFSELLYLITAEKISDTDYKIAGSGVLKLLDLDKWNLGEPIIDKLVIHAPKIILNANLLGIPPLMEIINNGKKYVYELQNRYVYVLKSIE
jgi:hypothetical protein